MIQSSTIKLLESIFLVALTFTGFYFSLTFGYLLTGEHEIATLFGIPFAVILTIYSGLVIFTKGKTKQLFRIITCGYVITLLAYILIMMRILRNEQVAEQYLYLDGGAISILKWVAGAGIAISLGVIIGCRKKLL